MSCFPEIEFDERIKLPSNYPPAWHRRTNYPNQITEVIYISVTVATFTSQLPCRPFREAVGCSASFSRAEMGYVTAGTNRLNTAFGPLPPGLLNSVS